MSNRWWPLIVLALLTSGAGAVERPADVAPALWERLVKIDEVGRKVTDMSARFVQRKFTPLLKEPLVSEGRVLVKKSRMLWVTAKPRESSVAIDGKEVRVYYPRQKVEEIYPLSARMGDAAASPLPRLDTLVKYFQVEALPAPASEPAGEHRLRLRLTPRDDEMKQYVAHVDLTVDTERACLLDMEIVDPSGERTRTEFSDIKLDGGVQDKDVELQLPEGTTIKRPLESISK